MCNLNLVALSRLKKTKNSLKENFNFEYLKTNMLGYHEERILFLLKRHLRFTNSSIAKKLLNNWDEEKRNFITVFPKDYRTALESLNQKHYILKKIGE